MKKYPGSIPLECTEERVLSISVDSNNHSRFYRVTFKQNENLLCSEPCKYCKECDLELLNTKIIITEIIDIQDENSTADIPLDSSLGMEIIKTLKDEEEGVICSNCINQELKGLMSAILG